MRLRKHREDVRWLQTPLYVDYEKLYDIATRYLNLIRMAEEEFNYIASLQWAGNPIQYRKWQKRVLKDVDGK